ncbi:MAG: RnfABCDGE type electron transport complex subunit D [Pseudomonadales bacterium]
MSGGSVPRLMIFVLLATIPAAILRLTQDGPALCLQLLAGPLGALAGEALLRRSLLSLKDGSALLTGWLLGLALPASAGPALAALAGALAIALGKAPFGGLGRNPFNPAMVGYASLLMLFPLASVDGLSGATPLAAFASREGLTVSEWVETQSGPWGTGPGLALSLACLAGGAGLLLRRAIPWHAPAGFLLGLLGASVLTYGGGGSSSAGHPLFHLFSGSALFAAFFIITDPVSGAHTPPGRLAMGALAGALTVLFRSQGPFPDGVAFAVLLANGVGPALDALAERRRQTRV